MMTRAAFNGFRLRLSMVDVITGLSLAGDVRKVQTIRDLRKPSQS